MHRSGWGRGVPPRWCAAPLTDDLHRYFAGTAALPTTSGDNTRKPDSKVTRIEGITTFAVHVALAATTCAILILAIRAGRSGSLSPGAVFTILAYILLTRMLQ